MPESPPEAPQLNESGEIPLCADVATSHSQSAISVPDPGGRQHLQVGRIGLHVLLKGVLVLIVFKWSFLTLSMYAMVPRPRAGAVNGFLSICTAFICVRQHREAQTGNDPALLKHFHNVMRRSYLSKPPPKLSKPIHHMLEIGASGHQVVAPGIHQEAKPIRELQTGKLLGLLWPHINIVDVEGKGQVTLLEDCVCPSLSIAASSL